MIVHNPEPKSPDDPNDRVTVLIYNSEVALKKVSLFPELDREKAWPDFISLRSWTAKLIKELHFISNQRKRARAKIEERMEALSASTRGIRLDVRPILTSPGMLGLVRIYTISSGFGGSSPVSFEVSISI